MERYDELCRLCASYDAVKMDLFGQEGKNRQLVDKIQTCLPFTIAENDRLPKHLCYRCMYNLENFYDFRTSCVNAVAMLERCLPTVDGMKIEIKKENNSDVEQYSELRMELLKDKEKILIPEAPVVNPNAALGTPPRLKSDDEDHKSDDEYEMDMETNPSDFLEMSAVIAEEEEHNNLPQPVAQAPQYPVPEKFQHRNEQHEVYVCSLCNKAFSSRGHLALHARIHSGAAGDVIGEKVITDDHTSYKRPYQCDLCNKSYSTAKHRWGHVSTTHKGHPSVTCRYCSRIYSTCRNLQEHVKSRHADDVARGYIPETRPHQCKNCNKVFPSASDLNKHSKVCMSQQQQQHQRNSSFNVPNYAKKGAKSKLKHALDPPSDISSIDSDYENKDYRSAEAKLAKNPHLTILKQALTKGDVAKKEYEERQKIFNKTKKGGKGNSLDMKRRYCEVCPANFATIDELREHEKTHDAQKPFICILCEKDFALKASLSRHIVSNHGVDPTPLIESDKCLKKSVKEASMQSIMKQELVIKQEQDSIKENCDSPFSTDHMDNDEEMRANGNGNMLEIETVFVCEICTRDFNDRASLWLHIRATHKEYAAFACGICLKICSDNAQLLNHVSMYHGGSKLAAADQRRYSCTICGRQHDSKKKLIQHVAIHNIDASYDPANFVQLNTSFYNESSNTTADASELIMDCEDTDGEKLDCFICYKTFPSEDQLLRHQRVAHKTEHVAQMSEQFGNGVAGAAGQNGTPRAQYHLFFVCELCGSSHPSKWERWLHVSNVHVDEPALKCDRDDCGKIFSTKSLRSEHAQHHSLQGSSPNTCEICGKLWGSRVDYWKHVMGVHSDTVPLICGVCLKIFPDVMQLSQHVKLKHWPLTNGDFSCDICGRPYSNKSKMSRHRKIHGLDGEPYNPSMANSSLIINDAMSEMSQLPGIPIHMDTTLPQPVQTAPAQLFCDMCGELRFATLEELTAHRRTVHSLFPCDLCNKCYGRTSHLWKHVNRVHKGHEDITCRYCLKTSASRDHLAAHIAKLHRYEPDVKGDVRSIINYKSYRTPTVEAEVVEDGDDVMHLCEKCNKAFNKRYLLKRHMKGCQNYRKDPGSLLTRCRACERIFKDRASLQKHIENHHSSYECHLCKETVTSKLGIMTHNRMHHMLHPDLTCELASCRKLFRTKEDLESHRKDHKHHGTPNVCDFCGDTVENKLKLKMHILSLHRNEIGVSCGVCLIPMKDPKDLKKHVEDAHNHVLSRPNTCQVCGKQYASKWKAFDHTKKCHGKVFRTCKQCLAVFMSDEDLRSHYEHIHNIPKDQLDAYQYRLEVAGSKMDDYDLGSLEVVVKEEPEELDFDMDPFDETSNDSKRRRSITDTFDCEICPEIFLNNELLSSHYRNVHNTDPQRMFKKIKLEKSSSKSKKKSHDKDTYGCQYCQKLFSSKASFEAHMPACSQKMAQQSTSILEAHLKNNNQIKQEEPEPILCESNLNIPDFNLFEDINMQLSGQKPVPSLMPLGHGHSAKSSKYARKDSRKVYDETSNTECTCEVCGKQWPAKKHLWQHLIRFHRAEAAVTCGVCLKLCSTYEELADHLKNLHPTILSQAGNNFTCKVCGRYHNARSKLLLHMSIHINCKSNVICARCNKICESDDKLREHIATCQGARESITPVDGPVNLEESVSNEQTDIVKQEIKDNGSLLGDEEGQEENEFESGNDNSENGDSSSDKSNDSDSNSGSSSDSSSDDEDEDSDNDDENTSRNVEDSSKDSDVVEEISQENSQMKHEIIEEAETMSLGEEDEEDDEDTQSKPRYEAMSESEDDEYLKKQQEQQQQEIQERYETPQKEPMLVNYSDDEERPALSPMLTDGIKENSSEHNKSDVSSDEEAEESDDEVLEQTEVVVDPNAALHEDENTRSSNEGEEEQEECEEQEVEEEQEEEEEEEEEEGEGQEQVEEENEIQEVGEEQEVEEHEEEDDENDEHMMNDGEILEVDKNEMHQIDGTVFMLANDADGNQIIIQRNVADLENDDSVHDMAQYVFQDGEGFSLEDYEAIVENQVGEEVEEHHSFEMVEQNQEDDEVEEVEAHEDGEDVEHEGGEVVEEVVAHDEEEDEE